MTDTPTPTEPIDFKLNLIVDGWKQGARMLSDLAAEQVPQLIGPDVILAFLRIDRESNAVLLRGRLAANGGDFKYPVRTLDVQFPFMGESTTMAIIAPGDTLRWRSLETDRDLIESIEPNWISFKFEPEKHVEMQMGFDV